jgi:hypothetical protein
MYNDIDRAELQILLQVVTELQSHNTRQRSKILQMHLTMVHPELNQQSESVPE